MIEIYVMALATSIRQREYVGLGPHLLQARSIRYGYRSSGCGIDSVCHPVSVDRKIGCPLFLYQAPVAILGTVREPTPSSVATGRGFLP